MDTAEVSAGPVPPRRRRGKRPLLVPDLAAIKDPAELKVQRRLLKNRRTAAASRCMSKRLQCYLCPSVSHHRLPTEPGQLECNCGYFRVRMFLRSRGPNFCCDT